MPRLYETPPFVWVLIYGYSWDYRRRRTLYFPTSKGKMPKKLVDTIAFFDEHTDHEYKLEKYFLEETLKGPKLPL